MAARLDSFGLSELTAKPDDALRLASLAMAEGRKIPGYGGDYYYDWIGDAAVIIRTRLDPHTGEEELLGLDTHARTQCLWSCRVVRDITPPQADPLSRKVLVQKDGQNGLAAVDLICAGVLPDLQEGMELRLGMVGFPLRISYDEGECRSVVEAQTDTVLLQGTVTDAKVGETFFGMEPLTKFISVTVSTPMGPVELCHPMDLVPENQMDLVRPGAVVSALCVLSGDCAVGEFAGGLIFDEQRNFQALSAFFRDGFMERLLPLLRSDCACTFLQNRQDGPENALALLGAVREDLLDAGLDRQAMGRLASQGRKGRLCLLLGGEAGFAFLCTMDLDSLGRVRELVITNDPQSDFEIVT